MEDLLKSDRVDSTASGRPPPRLARIGGVVVGARAAPGVVRLVAAVELAHDAVEDAVHKATRLARAVAAGDLDGLVEDDAGRGVAVLAELEAGEAQQVAVDPRHALEAPVARAAAEQAVDAAQAVADPDHQPLG